MTAQTAITHHAKRSYALLEVDHPFEVKVDKNSELFDIKSVGYDDFNGKLSHNVSAHPKVDNRTGHFMAFGYSREMPVVHYSVFDKNRELVTNINIPIASIRMLHDFAITENFSIIPDLPLENNPKNCVKDGKFIY